MITRENYEIWMIDYIEGTLDPEMKAAMEAFLLLHPDIREEMEGLEDAVLQAPGMEMEGKDALFQSEWPIDPKAVHEQLAALLEMDLSAEAILEVEAWIARYPKVAEAWKLMSHTRLHGESISFDHQSLLIPESVDYSRDEHLLIGALEGDLSTQQEQELQRRKQANPQLQKEGTYFAATRVQPNLSVTYPAKEELMKTAVVVSMLGYIRYAAAAAAVLIAVWWGWSSTRNTVCEGERLASSRQGWDLRVESVSSGMRQMENPTATEVQLVRHISTPTIGDATSTADERIMMAALDTRSTTSVSGSESARTPGGSIREVHILPSIEDAEIMGTAWKALESVGGLAGALLQKAEVAAPQALAFAESDVVQEVRDRFDVLRNERQADKGNAPTTNSSTTTKGTSGASGSDERVLIKMGKFKISKK